MAVATTDTLTLEALLAYGIMDTPNEPAFDRLTKVAAHMLGAPYSLLTFIDMERMWIKSSYGTEPTDVIELPRSRSFCVHTIAQGEMVILDTHQDTRFAAHPFVTGARSLFTGLPHLRFYAGVSLVTADGAHIGTICVLDEVPRTELAAGSLDALRALAGLAIDLLDGRRKILEVQESTRRTLLIDRLLADITLSSGSQPAFEGLTRSLAQTYHSTFGQLWLRSAGDVSFHPVSAYRDGAMHVVQEAAPDVLVTDLTDDLIGNAIRQDRPIGVAVSQPEPFADDKMIAASRALGLSHLVVVPFAAKDDDYVIALGFEGDGFDLGKRMQELAVIREGLKPGLVRKANEERLRLLSSALDMVPDGVIITRLDGLSNNAAPRIIYVNDSFCRVSGYASTELVGQTTSILHGAETSPANLQSLRIASCAGTPLCTSLVDYRRDGTTYTVEVDMVPIGEKEEAVAIA